MYNAGYFLRRNVVEELQQLIEDTKDSINSQISTIQTTLVDIVNTPGGITVDDLAPVLADYALKSEIPVVPPPPDLTPYALKTEIPMEVDLTPYATTTFVTTSLMNQPISNIFGLVDLLDTKAGWTDVQTVEAQVLTKADQTSLTPLALKTEIPDVSGKADTSYVEMRLASKPDSTELVVDAFASTIPSIQARFVSVASQNAILRVASGFTQAQFDALGLILVYQQPGGPPPVTTPTHEWIAHPDYYTMSGSTITEWIDAQNPTNKIVSSTYTVEAPSSVRPPGVRKGTGEMITGAFHRAKCTWFLVYSWPSTPGTDAPLVSTRGSVGQQKPDTMLYRQGWQWGYNTTNVLYNLPTPLTDTGVGVPYIVGVTWDFTVNPPVFTFIQDGRITRHEGSTTSLRINVNDTLDDITVDKITGVVGTFNVQNASNSTSIVTILGRFGGTGLSQPDGIVHHIGIWQDVYMSLGEVYACYHRLAQRYTRRTDSYSTPNVGINDAF